jgi:hypothetical protein
VKWKTYSCSTPGGEPLAIAAVSPRQAAEAYLWWSDHLDQTVVGRTVTVAIDGTETQVHVSFTPQPEPER